MRRTALLGCLLGLAVLGAGWLAIGAAGDAEKPKRVAKAAGTPVGTAELPPLPDKLRPRVAQPEAGASGAAQEDIAPATDPGLKDEARKPTQAASTGGRRPGGVLRDAGGGGVSKATALSNGVALPPFEAPEAVRQIIEAGNSIARPRTSGAAATAAGRTRATTAPGRSPSHSRRRGCSTGHWPPGR